MGPFTVDELVARGLHPTEACMMVWPVTDEAWSSWLSARRSLSEEQIVEIERQRRFKVLPPGNTSIRR